MENLVDNVVAPILAAVVMAGLSYLGSLVKKKWGLQISQQTQDLVASQAMEIVLAVEEKAAAFAKDTGNKWLSNEKHREAVNQILERVPKVTADQADGMVYAALAAINGLGATKNAVGR